MQYEEFLHRNSWSVQNAFTSAIKKALAGIGAVVIVASLANKLSHPSVAAATTTITTTTLPERLKDFARATERLISLRDTLDADLGTYQNAAMAALKRFDAEAKASTIRGCCRRCSFCARRPKRSSTSSPPTPPTPSRSCRPC